MPILIPARNSRHRFAALSLYRALLRSARDITVPVELPERVNHPVRWLIRGQFRRNRRDVSPRLVYTSLSAGYKFLDLFAKAKISGSPEHASVTNYVRSRLAGLKTWRARQPTPPPKEPLPPPILTRLPRKTDDPDEVPEFTSTLLPRPASALKGPRKIPRLAATSSGVPFLRLRKPQPERLTKKLLSLNHQAMERTDAVMRMKDDLLPEAALEDRWEAAVRRMLTAEQGRRRLSAAEEEVLGEDERRATYVQAVNEAKGQVQTLMNRTTAENVARARALLEIVKREKALAEEEARGAGDDARG